MSLANHGFFSIIRKGLNNPKRAKRHLQRKVSYPILEKMQYGGDGFDVMDGDWDNLIILDACRYDTFRRLAEQNGYFEAKIEARRSKGETTSRFLRENFSGKSFLDTIYISGNAVVGNHINEFDCYKFFGLWENDEDLPDFDRTYRDIVPPEDVVEKTVKVHEEYNDKRIIAHFLQPHPPFMLKDGEQLEKGSPYRDFTAARKGEVSRQTITEVYEENLQYTLDQVTSLVEHLKGKTVVTADHGELLGEGLPLHQELLHPRWSFLNRNRFDYAHYDHIRHRRLIEVPWVEIKAETRRDITKAEEPAGVEMKEEAIKDKLKALGYR